MGDAGRILATGHGGGGDSPALNLLLAVVQRADLLETQLAGVLSDDAAQRPDLHLSRDKAPAHPVRLDLSAGEQSDRAYPRRGEQHPAQGLTQLAMTSLSRRLKDRMVSRHGAAPAV